MNRTSLYLLLLVWHAATAPAQSLIHECVRTGDIPSLQILLMDNPTGKVNAVIGPGITPLHMAAAGNQTNICELLLAVGANPNATTENGFTPLHWAAGQDAIQAAALLICSGAGLNTSAAKGITPLHWAAGRNASRTVQLLLLAGADPHARTELGLTPLHYAVAREAGDAAETLANHIASHELQNKPPVTAPEPENADSKPVQIYVRDASDHRMIPTPHPGASMLIPLGYGEEMIFNWIESMGIWVSRFETTNGQYRRFRPDHSSRFVENFSLDNPRQPVVFISWHDAVQFTQWLNIDHANAQPEGFEFRLPTSEEWMAIARCGTDRIYPWGNEWPPLYGNYSDLTARENMPEWRGIENYRDGFPVTCSVELSGTNEWGLCGVGGNVWEWCEDWKDESRRHKIRHGGGWDFDTRDALAITYRGFDPPDTKDDNTGFRVIAAPLHNPKKP